MYFFFLFFFSCVFGLGLRCRAASPGMLGLVVVCAFVCLGLCRVARVYRRMHASRSLNVPILKKVLQVQVMRGLWTSSASTIPNLPHRSFSPSPLPVVRRGRNCFGGVSYLPRPCFFVFFVALTLALARLFNPLPGRGLQDDESPLRRGASHGGVR